MYRATIMLCAIAAMSCESKTNKTPAEATPADDSKCARAAVFDLRPGPSGSERFPAMVTWFAALEDCRGGALIAEPRSIRLTIDGEAVAPDQYRVVRRTQRQKMSGTDSDDRPMVDRPEARQERPVLLIGYCPSKPAGSLNTTFMDGQDRALAGAMLRYDIRPPLTDCDLSRLDALAYR